ncbi:hypothetical protein HYH02_002872 [Chlamydomonas schloesseri]|uniref:Patatin n=1 Tax=Chlamydomonas schloesseri TaxID=2026947 RepID=A0A835WR96_9CHLO|nr:hypothetical protein HYH02_002872 [Chlamydomonas schloesseri]|eukprot:KAG2452638.1 hypothetical protein HYH02_002872 [Chlamydomonas schloesseri]
MAATPGVWPQVVRPAALRPSAGPRIGRTPTLLSLDGGGMRGLISAQVLVELEDSIKQVLWKERLIEDVKPLLEDAAARKVPGLGSVAARLAEYESQVSSAGFTINEGHEAAERWDLRWDDYVKWQSSLLAPPKDWAVIKQCFDVDIGDWFDQLAGTSTGGLLALYLAARGGAGEARPSDPTLRPGSAAASSAFYEENGEKIFASGTEQARKAKMVQNFLDTAGYARHTKDGLEEVLHGVFGDRTLKSLEEHGANVLVTTVDVTSMRTGAFFHQSAKPSPAQIAAEDSNKDRAAVTLHDDSGLFTPLRKADKGRVVLVRNPTSPNRVETAESRQAMGWLDGWVNHGEDPTGGGRARGGTNGVGAGGVRTTTPRELRFLSAIGGWVAPMHSELLDFKLVDVARATSAAPTFLPPMTIMRPEGAANWPEEGRTFVDGGLGNNDPVFMGLAQLLQRNNNAGLQDCAVLSIGTGTKVAFDGYNPVRENPKLKGLLFWGMQLGLFDKWARSFAQAPVNGLKEKGPRAVVNAAKAVGGLVGLTMSINGEDKENILRSILYGLLHLPEGTYLRIQITDEASAGIQPKSDPQQPREVTPAVGGIAGAAEPTGVVSSPWGSLAPKDAKQEEQWRKALAAMDNPNPEILSAYKEMGKALAENYRNRIKWWVRCFLFGLEDAAHSPLLVDVAPKPLEIEHEDKVAGGKFITAAQKRPSRSGPAGTV